MRFDDILELPIWPIETWFLIRLFWYKNDFRAKYNIFSLKKLDLLQDLNTIEYWRYHNPML